MNDATPGVAKTIGAVLAGAIATIVVYILDQFLKAPLPGEIVAAVQTVFTVGVVYFTPHSVGASAGKTTAALLLFVGLGITVAGVSACSSLSSAVSTASTVSTDVAQACTVGAPVIALLQAKLPGNAALADVAAGCTLNGQVQMTLNDVKPVSVSNSGNSATWVTVTLAGLKLLAGLA